MIRSVLCAVLDYILGFLAGVARASNADKQAAERGYINIGDTTYKLVPMDKDAQ